MGRELVICPKGTGRWGTMDAKGNFVPDLKLDIHTFDIQKAGLCLELMRLGHTDKEIVERIGVSLSSISRWKREHKEFGAEYRVAKKERSEAILERSYGEDIVASYSEGETNMSVKLKATRAKMAQDYAKAVVPEDGVGRSTGAVTININMDKKQEKEAEDFVWATASTEL